LAVALTRSNGCGAQKSPTALSRATLAGLDLWPLFSTMTKISYAGYRFPPKIIRAGDLPEHAGSKLFREAMKTKILPRVDSFGVPGVAAMFGQPTIVGGRVFFGARNGPVYSLEAGFGCLVWDYAASAGVRSAITVARIGEKNLAPFGDRRGHVYALDAATGTAVRKVNVADGAAMQITCAPMLFEGRPYVPISGGDDSAAIVPKYDCCKGRGAVVALDAATGATIWKAFTIPEASPAGRK
jgi:outer membrane protein assembly factor BamB